jgi:hypothetical protein
VSATPLPEALLVALAELREEMRAMRAELRALRQQQAEPALLVALEEEFGPGRFTAGGLLKIADEEPHTPIADAIAAVIDMNAAPHSRATALGTRLRRMVGIETVAKSHGTSVYRLRVASVPEPI